MHHFVGTAVNYLALGLLLTASCNCMDYRIPAENCADTADSLDAHIGQAHALVSNFLHSPELVDQEFIANELYSQVPNKTELKLKELINPDPAPRKFPLQLTTQELVKTLNIIRSYDKTIVHEALITHLQRAAQRPQNRQPLQNNQPADGCLIQ